MRKIKVFISSVQSEFADERQMLFDYLMQYALLGLFFELFIFERVPASYHRADNVYLDKVAECDVYLGIFGKEYGLPDNTGTSPTEYEYSHATNLNKVRLIFISHHSHTGRHTKITDLIKRAEKEIVRKKFSNPSELKTAVYTSLVRYLEEKEYIRTGPFDASVCSDASLPDIDIEKIIRFVTIAKAKRGFPLPAESPVKDILTHLNLLQGDKLTNAALLLFGKKPQRFFMSSEIKCAQFHGYEIVKPIPTYQVYKGDVFQLVDQAVDFVLSRIDVSTGTRDIIRLCKEKGLKEPDFKQEDVFKIIIWRTEVVSGEVTGQVSGQATDHVTDHVDALIIRIISILFGEMSRNDLMNILELNHSGNFRENYLHPALENGYIEMTIPDKLKSIKQKYRLTAKGLKIKENLKEK